jgi:hypothetical protein
MKAKTMKGAKAMSTMLDTQKTQEKPLSSLSGTAANDDLIPSSKARSAETAVGWDAYEVWRRLIKDARDRREGMAL